MFLRSEPFDVCVVGSGAAGGIAAYVLTQKGLRVALLEAGRPVDPSRDYLEHVWPYELRNRGFGKGAHLKSQWRGSEFWSHLASVNLPGEPYTVAGGRKFHWYRTRLVGGRTNVWGRKSLRFSKHDFKARSLDGAGEDWPIDYADVAPYYDRVERLIGVTGTRENLPILPDGIFQPAPPFRCYENLIKKGAAKLGIPVIAQRFAVITQPHDGRAPCHYCGACQRGCVSASRFSSNQVLIPKALSTGRLALLSHSMAVEVTVDAEMRASGVLYVDKQTGQTREIRSRTVIVAGGTLESTRLLLYSTSSRFPNGIANSSGLLGKNFVEHIGASVSGYFPQLERARPTNEDGILSGHAFIPWWGYRRKNPHLRGYHVEMGGGAQMFPGHAYNTEGFGSGFKAKVRALHPAVFSLGTHGEMLPNPGSFVELDPSAKDALGIPVLKIHFEYGENERLMFKAIIENLQQIIEASGGKVRSVSRDLRPPGQSIHELGTARMGDNPKTSVVNRYCQAHDIPNLFVNDGACFTSGSDKNPTLTIMALSWRASDYLAEEMRKGNL